MTLDIQHVNSGDRVQFSAAMHNRLVEMIAEYVRGHPGEPTSDYQTNKCYVFNEEDVALDMFSVVGLGDPKIAPPTAATPGASAFKFNKVVKSASPSPLQPFGILQRPAPIGGIADIVVSGETMVLVNFTNAAHEYAAPASGDYQKLVSQEAVGPVRVLWKDPDGATTGVKWAWVLIDANAADTVVVEDSVHIWSNCSISGVTPTVLNHNLCGAITRLAAGSFKWRMGVDFGSTDNYVPTAIVGNNDNWYWDKSASTRTTCVLKTASGTDPAGAFGLVVHGEPVIADNPVGVLCGPCTTTNNQYCVDIIGVTNGTATSCEDDGFGAGFHTPIGLVRDDDGCLWYGHVESMLYPADFDKVPFDFYLEINNTGVYLYVTSGGTIGIIGGTHVAIYSNQAGGWDCNSAIVLALGSPAPNSYCDDWPATVTLAPCGGVPNFSPPLVHFADDNLCHNATTISIAGGNFDAAVPGNNTVAFNLGAAGTVTAAAFSSLTVSFTTNPTSLGALTAAVTNSNGTSATVQAATVVACPTVTLNTNNACQDDTSIVITGTNFDAGTPGNNTVVFNLGASGTVASSTSTSLTVTYSVNPTSFGSLTAIVTTPNGSSTPAVQVATVIDCIAGIAHRWSLNEGTGDIANAVDIDGAAVDAFDLDNLASATWDADAPTDGVAGPGGSASFDGSTNGFWIGGIAEDLSTLPTGNAARSVSFWVKVGTYGVDNRILEYGDGADSFIASLTGAGTGLVVGVETVTATCPTAGMWAFCVVAWDGAGSNNNRITYWLNGTQEFTSAGYLDIATDSTGTLILGQTFDGLIKDVRIYDSALSSANVLSLYDPPLAFYDTFTDSNATLIENHSPNIGGGYTIVAGALAVSNNTIVCTSAPSNEAYAWCDPGVLPSAGIMASFNFQFTDINQAFLIGVRFDSADNTAYWAYIDEAGSFILNDGTIADIYSSILDSATVSVSQDVMYTLEIFDNGTEIRAYLNGTEISTVTSTGNTRTKVAVAMFGSIIVSDCWFDNFRVRED